MRGLEVLRPGPLTTVQDLGRPGYAHLGVPRSGALDQPAARLANRLVGNHDALACLETTLGGLVLRASSAMTVAVTGAPTTVAVGDRTVAFAEPVVVRAGDTVSVRSPRAGVRSYVGVAGGVAVETTLGSRSTDLLSGLGPPPLRAGQWLPVGEATGLSAGVGAVPAEPPGDPVRLTVLPGPRWEWFDDTAQRRLFDATYVVASASNRVGLRLQGAELPRRTMSELPSEGLVLGAVEVPPNAQPLVLLADHPTTGGYPVIGVVDPSGVTGCAQARPGDRVRFTHRAGG